MTAYNVNGKFIQGEQLIFNGIEEGNVIGILGANGTGKTTAISLLAGESIPNLGEFALLFLRNPN